MQENRLQSIRKQPRFNGIFEKTEGFARRIELTSHMPLKAIEVRQDGLAVSELESGLASFINKPFVIATNSGTSAIHLALKLVAHKIYGTEDLSGKRVFCSDLCPVEQAMPILYENGIPTFIDVTDYDFGMDPECLVTAFETYPDTKIVIMNHVYGFPGKILEVKKICEEHGAILIENASESLGATVDGKQTGSIGDIGILDFAKDRIITGGCGGALILSDEADDVFVRKMANMALRDLKWNHCDGIGYDYSMNDVTAAIILEQLSHLDEIIDKKKRIYEFYKKNLNEDLTYLIEADEKNVPNYWMPVIMCDSSIEAGETRTADGYSYEDIHGTTSPMEIVDALDAFGAEVAPVYMPMSLQPVFENGELIGADGVIDVPKAYADDNRMFRDECSGDAFKRSVCLPADLSMTEAEQDKIIDIIHSCFDKTSIDRAAFEGSF